MQWMQLCFDIGLDAEKLAVVGRLNKQVQQGKF